MTPGVLVRKDDDASERCTAIGNIITGLYYLSKEADRAGLRQVADAINSAIGDAVDIGRQEFSDGLKRSAESAEHDSVHFLNSFCTLRDAAALSEIKSMPEAAQTSSKSGTLG